MTAQMYGLEYREVPAEAWHADVKATRSTPTGKPIASFDLDLYPRDGKFKHAAMFPSARRSGCPTARYQTPRPRSSATSRAPRPAAPALMEHADVVTFFHEFGHVLHHVLTRARARALRRHEHRHRLRRGALADVRGVGVEQGVLDKFARTTRRAKKIPDGIFAAMTKSRAFGRALDTQRQLFLATLDHEYHTREPGFDTTKMVAEVQKANDPFAYVDGHALPVELRAPRRLRRGLLQLPVGAVALARRADALQEGGADEQGRPRAPGATRCSPRGAARTSARWSRSSWGASRTKRRTSSS